MILVAALVAAVLVFAALGFLLPRWSHRPQAKVHQGADKARQSAPEAPAPLDRAVASSASAGEKAADTSVQAGRKARERAGPVR